MSEHELSTTEEVILALGGVRAVAELTGRKYTAACNWANFQTFPPDTFVVMKAALTDRGYAAPNSLWRMVRVRGVA
jgi:ABC-type hemin transport system substrate-binding protein